MGNGPEASVVAWTLVGLAGNFYLSVITETIAKSVAPSSMNITPTAQASRSLFMSLVVTATCVVVARYSMSQIVVLSLEGNQQQKYGDLFFALFYLLGVALLIGVPIVAGMAGAQVVNSFHTIVDRSTEPPIYGVLSAVIGFGVFALTGYLMYKGMVQGERISIQRGICPSNWGTNL
jgi:hypothetical protein